MKQQNKKARRSTTMSVFNPATQAVPDTLDTISSCQIDSLVETA
jgi:hypothetical protein